MIPCKTCLKYVFCKPITEVNCDDLFDYICEANGYYDADGINIDQQNQNRIWWKNNIKVVFPNIITVGKGRR